MTNLTGLNFDIVINLINKYGVSVIVTPITKTTSNIEGDETLSEGTNYSEQVYFSKRSVNWKPDSAGLIEGADAIALIKPTSNIKKDDKITHNNYTYRVQSVINRDQAGGGVMYKTVTLFII